MSISAKQHLIKQIEHELGNVLTAVELNIVQEKLNIVLGMFDVNGLESGQIDMETDDFLTAFLDAKEIEGRSPKTIKHYRYIINRALTGSNTPIRQITIFHLRSYLMKMKSDGIADKTLEGIRSVICSFFGWLQKEGLLKENPCANLSPIKCAKKVRTPYTTVDIERLKESCSCARDKALISFLLSTGCRVSEVCGLDKCNVNFTTNECTVLGKGNKERTVFIDDVTVMLLKRYIDERTDDSPALFVGKGTNRMTPGGIRARLHNIADTAHVENVHPHRFRRTLATTLINHGMQIQDVASILGHDKLDTTMKYVFIDKVNVKNEYRKYA
jgi:site-specific recombinase XerD